MKTLPPGLTAYRRTPIYSEDRIPAGLLGRHQTKPGVWAAIRVLEGSLLYHILGVDREAGDGVIESVELTPLRAGIVAPEEPHRIAARDRVRFFVEFYRRADDD